MNPVLRPFLLLFLFVAFPLHHLCAQGGNVHSKPGPLTVKETYGNGKIKSITVSETKVKPFNKDLFNVYKTTKVVRTEFDSISGNKTSHSVRMTKIGVGGKHCYEYFYKRTDYDAQGRRKHFEKSKCDKHKYRYKDYENGKVIFIHIEKKRRRKA